MVRDAARALVCSIGSTDPTAAAGLFADAWVFRRLGIASTFVVAGVTAQNSARVAAVEALSSRLIRKQLECVWEQTRPDAVKIGLVPGASAIDAIDRFFRHMRQRPKIVLDPVLASTSGHRFAGAAEIRALQRLMDVATLTTPNALEAAMLASMTVRSIEDAERAAGRLRGRKNAVLVKGGHLLGNTCTDILAQAAGVIRLTSPRVARDMRGSGCVLAAAIAVYLARGASLETAVRRARAFVRAQLRSSRPLGKGLPQLR